MDARKTFFPVLLVLGVAAFVIGRSHESGRGSLGAQWSPELESLLRKQKAERAVETLELARTLSLSGSGEMQLYGPLQLDVGPAGELAVLDAGDLRIKEFSADGKPLRSFGRGKGQGPGELLSTTDFVRGADGSLWVADLLNGRLAAFHPDGREQMLKLKTQPYRLVLRPDGSFFLMFGLIHDRVFGLFDAAGNERKRFGQWLEKQGLNAMLLDGWIRPAGDGFVYVGRYSGLLAAFDGAGEPIFVTETVDGAGLPRILKDDGGKHWVDREAPETARSVSVCRGEIVVFTVVESGLQRRGLLDRYALAGGSYLGSWKLQGASAVSVLCTDDALYLVGERSIERLALPPDA